MSGSEAPFIFYPSFPPSWLGATICYGYDADLCPICPDETKVKRDELLATEPYQNAMKKDIKLGNTGQSISKLPELITPNESMKEFTKPILMGINMTQIYGPDKIKKPEKDIDHFFDYSYVSKLFKSQAKTPKYMCIMPECIVGSCKFDMQAFKDLSETGTTNRQTVRVSIIPNTIPFNKISNTTFRDVTNYTTKLIAAAIESEKFYNNLANSDKSGLITTYYNDITKVNDELKDTKIDNLNSINTIYDEYKAKINNAWTAFKSGAVNVPSTLYNPGDYSSFGTFFGDDKRSLQNTILLQNQALSMCKWYETESFEVTLAKIEPSVSKNGPGNTVDMKLQQNFDFSKPDMLIGYAYHKDYKPFNVARIPIASEKDFYNDTIIKNTYGLTGDLEKDREKVFLGGVFRDTFTLQLVGGKPKNVIDNEKTFIILNGPSYKRIPPTNYKGLSPLISNVTTDNVTNESGQSDVKVNVTKSDLATTYYANGYMFGPYVFKQDSTKDNIAILSTDGTKTEPFSVENVYSRMTENVNGWPKHWWNLTEDMKNDAIRYKLSDVPQTNNYEEIKKYFNENGINQFGFPGADYADKMCTFEGNSGKIEGTKITFSSQDYELPTYKDKRTEKNNITRKTFPLHDLIVAGIKELFEKGHIIDVLDRDDSYRDINTLTTDEYIRMIENTNKYYDLGAKIKEFSQFSLKNGDKTYSLFIDKGTVCPYKLVLLKGKNTLTDPNTNKSIEVTSSVSGNVHIYACIFPAVVFNNIAEKENFICQFVPTYQYEPNWYIKSSGISDFPTLIPPFTPGIIGADKINENTESNVNVYIRPEDIYLSSPSGFFSCDRNKYTVSKDVEKNIMGDKSLYITANGFLQTDLSYINCEENTNSADRYSKEMSIIQGRMMKFLKEDVIPNPDWYKTNTNIEKHKEWELKLKKYYNDKSDGREVQKEPFKSDYADNKCLKIIGIVIIIIVCLLVFGIIIYFVNKTDNYNKTTYLNI